MTTRNDVERIIVIERDSRFSGTNPAAADAIEALLSDIDTLREALMWARDNPDDIDDFGHIRAALAQTERWRKE